MFPPKTSPARPWRPRIKFYALALLIIIVAWVAFDFYGPRASSLRAFDPNELARLETAMWRSYYDKKEARLFAQLAEMLRSQYHLPFARSNVVAYEAARAAFVFKGGHDRADYEKALPYLIKFYQAIRANSDTAFDVERAARLELEWWIVHRQRAQHAPGDLDRALVAVPAELYHLPAADLMEHARLRQEAMTIRDERAEAGGVSEADWARIDQLLHASWQSLYQAVNR